MRKVVIALFGACSTLMAAPMSAIADANPPAYWPAPYPTQGWPAQHHDAHSSDWIPAAYPSFQSSGTLSNIAWFLRDPNNPAVCIGGATIAVLETQEYFVVTSGKIRSPNVWVLNMGDGSIYWHSAPPTNSLDPGPDSLALTVSPVNDKYGNIFLADSRYVYCYSLAYVGSDGRTQPWTWRAPMPNLKTYNTNDGLWHPATDPTIPNTKGYPFMSFVLTPEVNSNYYVGGFTVEGEIFMFDPRNGALFAKGYLETNVIGVVTGAAPADPYAFAATNDPMDLSTNNPIIFGIWATGSNTDDPDLDYFMNPIQLQGYLAAGTFGAGTMIANNPCLARDPTNAAKCRLYVPGRQSSESARYDSNTNIADAILYRVDFDPGQPSVTGRLAVVNYDYPVTPGVGRFDGRMVNGESSATSPDLTVNEKWVFAGDNQSNMYCFSADTGAINWGHRVGSMLGSPTTCQALDSNGCFTFLTFGDYEPWIFNIDAASGQIVSNATHGLMARHLQYNAYITNYCWRTEPEYQTDFYTPGTHELWQRKAIGASIIVGASNLFEMVYTVGWQRPNDPSGGLWLVPTHQIVMALNPERVWDYTDLAQTIQGAFMDTNGTSEAGLIPSPSANSRGMMFYGCQSCCVANFLNVNHLMPVGMKPLYMRPYCGLGLFALPFFGHGLVIEASDGRYADKIALAWNAANDATGYQVWRHTADDSSAASQIGTTADTRYSDTSASGGTLYYYWVKATNAATTSAFSASDSGWRRSAGHSHYDDADLDGDRKADLVIFDPLTGTWRAKLSGSGYAEVSGIFGDSACTLVPGDYDGDRMTDPGIYAELTGRWTVMLSSMGYSQASATLGGMGYAPAPGDYDGDLKTDPGIYRTADGGWMVLLSASGYAAASAAGFGGPELLPVQRDYDGDRKYDPAIYHLTDGTWRVMLSGSGYGIATAVGFGGTGYAPVVGDYDADGKADPALYAETTGLWAVMLSGNGYLIATGTLGGTGYAALPGDYDGDGRTDPAVYNTATGRWLVMLSGSGYGIATATFGGEGFDPVGFRPEQDPADAAMAELTCRNNN